MSTLNIIGWSILLVTWASMLYLAVGQTTISTKTRMIWGKTNLVLSLIALSVFITNIFLNIL
jgi:hypothetical protein